MSRERPYKIEVTICPGGEYADVELSLSLDGMLSRYDADSPRDALDIATTRGERVFEYEDAHYRDCETRHYRDCECVRIYLT